MPITYTNRKGLTYFLCRGITKTGRPRYFFARQPRDEPMDSMPSGYQIAESVNGVVSLVKERPRLIAPEERAAIEAALIRHPKSGNYRLAVNHKQIVVYERQGPDIEGLSAVFADLGPLPQSVMRHLERSSQFTPILRFVLHDVDQRKFIAERWCFLGSIDDWINAGDTGDIEALARKLIPLLGTEQFFDLY
jgi:hypothetical protein